MTITSYNSNNSLAPEFIWTSFEMDELINIPTKAEERSISMIQILFRTQGPNRRPALSGIRVKNYGWSTIHCVFKIRQSTRFTAKIHNPCVFKAKSIDPKTYSPPSNKDLGLNFVWRWCRSFQSWYSLKEKAIIFQQRQVIKLTGSLAPLMSASKPISLFCFVVDALVVVVFEVVVIVFEICCSQQHLNFKQRK